MQTFTHYFVCYGAFPIPPFPQVSSQKVKKWSKNLCSLPIYCTYTYSTFQQNV